MATPEPAPEIISAEDHARWKAIHQGLALAAQQYAGFQAADDVLSLHLRDTYRLDEHDRIDFESGRILRGIAAPAEPGAGGTGRS